jgi:NarL family two-component system response regulator LiaR
MTEKMKLVVIDDHLLLRSALRVLVSGFDEIEVAADGRFDQALELVAEHNPDVTLLNLVACDGHLIDITISQILTRVPTTHILLMANQVDDPHLMSAFKHGAMGCLLSDSTPPEISQALRVLINGGSYLPAKMGQRLLHGNPAQVVSEERDPFGLSPRQIAVLRLVGQGLTNQNISEKLKISKRTAEMHIYKIFKKLKVNNRTQAVQAAIRHGILDVSLWSVDLKD